MAKIKTIIESKTEIPISRQNLYFNGKKLDDDLSVAAYGFKEKSCIKVVAGEFQIYVHNLAQKQITLDVQRNDTIGYLKNQIRLMQNKHYEEFGLSKSQKKELEDDKTLVHYGIGLGTKLDMFEKFRAQNNGIQIFVNLGNKTVVLNVQRNETIRNLKIMIQHRAGIPVFQQRFIFRCKQLENGNLTDYNITRGSTIQFHFRWAAH